MSISTKKIIISCHIIFDESSFPFSAQKDTPQPAISDLARSVSILLPLPPTTTSDTNSRADPPHIPNSPSQNAPLPAPQSLRTPSTPTCDVDSPNLIPTESASTNSSEPRVPVPSSALSTQAPNVLRYASPEILHHHMQTRARSGIVKPKQILNLLSEISPIPKTYHAALKDPNWRQAMREEFDALLNNNTWCLVEKPVGANIITGKWNFWHKLHPDGSLARYKARWVVRGFNQEYDIDYGETFSLVIKPATICPILSIANSSSWAIHQLDVKNAFLHGNLLEHVYCAQPSGFVDTQKPQHICKLVKSLYGLKQAPRTWFLIFTSHLHKLGFTTSKSDSSLFTLHNNNQTTYLLLYVNDIILTASSASFLRSIIQCLCREFAMTDLGPLKHFLGIHVRQHEHGLLLSQEQYARDVLKRAGMLNCNSATTPINTKAKLSSTDGDPLENAIEYRSLAGALHYLTITRPNITYAVQQVFLFMHAPRSAHLQLIKRILRYVRGTISHGLFLRKSNTHDLVAYSDSDWAGCPDTR
jgi:hypothetical protein